MTEQDYRETDLSRTGIGGPVTDEDVLLVRRLTNPEDGRLEQAIRADERRIVAEEIAEAIEARAARLDPGIPPHVAVGFVDLLRSAATLAREYREVQG
jgi:hypothetical protein